MEAVGEQSPFVDAIGTQLSHNMTLLRDALANSRKYLTQFCVKFSSGFISKYIHHLLRCRPVSSAGAEQLLLNTHSLRTLLLELPTLGAQTANLRRAPASYTKVDLLISLYSFNNVPICLQCIPTLFIRLL